MKGILYISSVRKVLIYVQLCDLTHFAFGLYIYDKRKCMALNNFAIRIVCSLPNSEYDTVNFRYANTLEIQSQKLTN